MAPLEDLPSHVASVLGHLPSKLRNTFPSGSVMSIDQLSIFATAEVPFIWTVTG